MNTKLTKKIALAVCMGALDLSPALAGSVYEPYTFTTIAGTAGVPGSTDGTNDAARFFYPGGLAVDNAGVVYMADFANCTIRKLTPVGTDWAVTTLAGLAGSVGSDDGTNSDARFNGPVGVALDSAGNLYVGEIGNNTIRKVSPVGTDWVVTTLAGLAGVSGSDDGTNSNARFNWPWGIAADQTGNLYVSDFWNDTIRRLSLIGTNWVVTTLAGMAGVSGSEDGTNSDARFTKPLSVTVDSAGDVYVADGGFGANNTIRRVTRLGPDWVVTTLAGQAGLFGSDDGTNSVALFNNPGHVVVDSAGNLYVADWRNDEIRKVTPVGNDWVVTTLAGSPGESGSADGTGSDARFFFYDTTGGGSAGGVAVDSAGNLYVTDTYNHAIRKGYREVAIVCSGTNFGFSNGHFGFELTGPAGRAAVVEVSADLVNWLPVWTNTFMVGPLQFTDADSAYAHRFYRARKQ